MSKNAVTFLKRVAVLEREGEWLDDFFETHHRIGYTDRSPYLVRVADMPAYEAEHGRRHKFAVWRDPVARLESYYSLYVLGGTANRYVDYLDLRRDNTWERFSQFLAWEWGKADPAHVDEHIRRQSDYYSRHQVDDVVPISAMHAFLTAHGVGFREERSNSTNTGFRITDETVLAGARQYYAADLALLAP